MKGGSVVGSLTGIMKGRNGSMDIKRGLKKSILLPTLTYGSENWTWNGAQQSRVRAVDMSWWWSQKGGRGEVNLGETNHRCVHYCLWASHTPFEPGYARFLCLARHP